MRVYLCVIRVICNHDGPRARSIYSLLLLVVVVMIR